MIHYKVTCQGGQFKNYWKYQLVYRVEKLLLWKLKNDIEYKKLNNESMIIMRPIKYIFLNVKFIYTCFFLSNFSLFFTIA